VSTIISGQAENHSSLTLKGFLELELG